MHHADAPTFDPEVASRETLNSFSDFARSITWKVGLTGLAVAFLASLLSKNGQVHLAYSYLIALAYVVSISLGALFFVAVQHVTRAGWSVTVRRLAEILAMGLIPVAPLFLPLVLLVLMGSTTPFVWANAKFLAEHPLIQAKTPYLNSIFFVIRNVIYFAFWAWLARRFLTLSRRQDVTGDPAISNQLEATAAPSLLVFALTLTFFAFDWLMSLQPEWFSTIFGVYYFAGGVMAFFATVSLVVIQFQASGRMQGLVTVEHRHDLGKFLFGFVCFWAYMAISQYLLIWYANIPEETEWFGIRQNNGWEYVSLILIFGHFVLPFLGLMSRHVKRNVGLLRFWTVWLLVMHWVDLYWLVMPALYRETGPSFGVVDIGCMVGVIGLWLAGIQRMAGDAPLVPLRDPRMHESLAFHNI